MVIGFAEMIMIMIIVLILTYGFVLPIVRRRVMLDKPKRGVLTGEDGEVVIVGARERSKPFRKSGIGSFASDALPLFEGVYRLEYAFPPESPVAVKLIRIEDAEEIDILIKSGTGSHAFRVPTTGRYVVDVDPTDDTLAWDVAFRQL